MIRKKKSRVGSKSAVEKRKKTIEKKNKKFQEKNTLDSKSGILQISEIRRDTFYKYMDHILG